MFFSVLGWDSLSWLSLAPSPDSEFKDWDELSDVERLAAKELGYLEGSWQEEPLSDWNEHDLLMVQARSGADHSSSSKGHDFDPLAVPSHIRGIPFLYERFQRWHSLSQETKLFAEKLRYTKESWEEPGTNAIEAKSYWQISRDKPQLRLVIDDKNWTAAQWDCFIVCPCALVVL